ncbi:hypothetical protein [Teredinibacter purpureus]|jgi:hypothetical protein|uniref:hypothetical protein n=1 Tax=Teredinibacter purpureus TaxID=2731756 RepID=UPI0005F85969|nr:hypothetical protein [Teredinibacter purpureus]
MKNVFLIFSLFLAGLANAEDGCAIPQGTETGNPLVKVSPKVSGSIPSGSCALVSFMLKEKPGTEGKALVPTSIEVEKSTNKKLAKAVKTAVSKWLYLSKSHNATTKYYYSYAFISE